MKLIYLSKLGKYAQVDDTDYDYCRQFKWYYHNGGYAFRVEYFGYTGKKQNRKDILMHRDFLKPEKELVVDHVDGNGLNNQRDNLRVATVSQNGMNRTAISRNNTSGHMGVVWDTNRGRWRSQIQVQGKMYNLGRFTSLNEAIAVRKAKATEFHGEFASKV